MAKLTVLGSINVDHLMQVAAAPRAGQTIEAKQYNIVAGGKGANQAVAAAKLGADVAMIGCIGSDAIGQQMKADFAGAGVNTQGIEAIEGESTGLAMIYVDDSGENRIGIWPGANGALTPSVMLTKDSTIAQADMLLMQLESPIDTLIKASEIAKKAGTKVVLNPAPAKALPDELLNYVDIITPNETEAEQLTGIAIVSLEDAERAANKLHTDFGIDTVLITLGKRGVWLSAQDSNKQNKGQHIAGFVVNALDTTAAGDTFNAGFVTAMLENKTLLEAVRFGQGAAAISVTRMGAQSSIPTRKETLEFIAAQA